MAASDGPAWRETQHRAHDIADTKAQLGDVAGLPRSRRAKSKIVFPQSFFLHPTGAGDCPAQSYVPDKSRALPKLNSPDARMAAADAALIQPLRQTRALAIIDMQKRAAKAKAAKSTRFGNSPYPRGLFPGKIIGGNVKRAAAPHGRYAVPQIRRQMHRSSTAADPQIVPPTARRAGNAKRLPQN